MLPRLTLPLPAAALALLAAAFIVPGLAGHDPWKSQDAIAIAIAHGMAASGDLLVPRVAGMRWLHDPPLYHWIAAAFGRIFQLFLEFHAAARLASGVLVAAAFWLTYRAARDWSGEKNVSVTGSAALLILLGSVGLMVHAHQALPELAALAALCGALAALPHAQRRPLAAGIIAGASLGLAFLAAGWIAPAALALAIAAAHLACPQWRNRRGAAFFAGTATVALLLAVSWPLALALHSSGAFLEWSNLAFRPKAEALASLRQVLATGSWFAWPAWPLALWAAWSLRRRWSEPQLFVPGLATLALIAGQAWLGAPQDEHLIALLAPLALLAAHAVSGLRRGATAALDWFGVLTFAFFTALVWLGYVAMLTGFPPRIEYNFARTAPGFAPQFEPLAFATACLLAIAWLYVVFFTASSPLRSLTRWAAGIVLLWGTFAMLWMSWADYQKSYRPVALQLRSRIPVDAQCIAQKSLGVSQAAALDYHAGIRARPFDLLKPESCRLLLVQGSPKHELDAPGRGWTKLADVGRPGDKAERYRLYRLAR